MELTHGLVGVRLLVGQPNQLPGVGRQQAGDEGLVVLHLVAASAEVALHIDVGSPVPGQRGDGIAVGVGLRRVVLTADDFAVLGIQLVDAVTLEDDVLAAAGDDEGLHALLLIAVGRADDGREGAIAVGGHVELVEDEVHGEQGRGGCVGHVDVHHRDLRVGTGLLAGETDGLLGTDDGDACKEDDG